MKLSALAASIACAALCLTTNLSPVSAAAKDFKGVSAKIIMRSNPQRVWKAIRDLRDGSPDDVRTISQSAEEDILEETFDDLPVIGKAKCRYREVYKPFERIDYRMIESDHFKAFEGSWVLTPTDSGAQTVVELSSYIDTGLCIPFVHQITNMATMRNVHSRLQEVKKIVETQPKRKLTEVPH
jgi:hypothetical protein